MISDPPTFAPLIPMLVLTIWHFKKSIFCFACFSLMTRLYFWGCDFLRCFFFILQNCILSTGVSVNIDFSWHKIEKLNFFGKIFVVVSSFQCQIWYNSSYISVLALISIYIHEGFSIFCTLSLSLCFNCCAPISRFICFYLLPPPLLDTLNLF